MTSSSKPKPILICITGAIASGKSTLSLYINKYLLGETCTSKFFTEPIPKQLLKLFLDNLTSEERSILSFAIQHTYSASRFRDLVIGAHSGVDYVVQDQGVWFDLAFLEALKDTISLKEYTLYKELINQRIEKIKSMFSEIRIIFIDNTLDTCIMNMKIRARDGESNYDRVYLGKVVKEMKKVYNSLDKSDDYITKSYIPGPPSTNVSKNRRLLTKTCGEILKLGVVRPSTHVQ